MRVSEPLTRASSHTCVLSSFDLPQLAQLKKLPQRPGKNWAWCLWETTLKLPPGAQPGSKLRLTCRAVDDNMSAQPDGIGAIWNMRGVNNNAWHRVELTVV